MTLSDRPPLYLADVDDYVPALGTAATLRFSSGVGFVTLPTSSPANTYFDARIQQPVDVARHIFTGGSTQGASRVGVGDLVLANGDGVLDDLSTYGFDGRAITIWRSSVLNPSYPFDFDRIFVGTMAQAEFDTTTVTLKIRDRLLELTAPLQTNKFAGTNSLPNGLEGVATDLQGKPKPLCFGVVANIAPPCVNTSKLIYQVNDGTVNSVDHVYDRGVALTVGATYATLADLLDDAQAPAAGAFKAYPAGGYFRLGSSPAGQVTADVTQGATAADRTAAQIFSGLIERTVLANPNAPQLGFIEIDADSGQTMVADDGAVIVAIEDLSNADLVALDAANSAVLGLYVDAEMAIADACDLVANSVGAWWGVDATGIFRIQQFTAPSGSPVATITANDLLEPLKIVTANDPGAGLPVWRSTVQYGQIYTPQTSDLAGSVSDARRAVIGQQWRNAVSTDTSVQMANLLAPETIEPSLLTTLADAQAEADRRQALRGVQRNRFELVVPLTSETNAIDLGAVIALVHSRMALSTGGDDSLGALCRVLDVAPNAKDGRVTLTVWGTSAPRNIASDDGLLITADDGTYIITARAA